MQTHILRSYLATAFLVSTFFAASSIVKGQSPGVNVPTEDTIVIQTPDGGVRVKNFYKTAWSFQSNGNIVQLIEVYTSGIAFERNTSSFQIFINYGSQEEFRKTRRELEKKFLNILEITPVEACKLNVTVTGGNKIEGWNDYKLSYCSAKKPLTKKRRS